MPNAKDFSCDSSETLDKLAADACSAARSKVQARAFGIRPSAAVGRSAASRVWSAAPIEPAPWTTPPRLAASRREVDRCAPIAPPARAMARAQAWIARYPVYSREGIAGANGLLVSILRRGVHRCVHVTLHVSRVCHLRGRRSRATRAQSVGREHQLL